MIPAAVTARYQVLRRIGDGASSVVYEARDRHDPEAPLVAVKVLRPEHRLRPDLCLRFLREALPIEGLRHPGLPRILSCALPAGESPYIVMERLHGSLAGRLLAGPPPLAEALACAAQLAQVLHAIHGHGIIHRDVKPANVLFTGAGRCKLVDFGLAKWPASGASDAGLTAEDDSLGTAEYMAPEQAHSAARVGPSADVYSLGVLLYELLRGVPPFQAESAGPLRVMHMLAPPPLLHDAGWPAGLGPLCLKMLAKDPAQRPTALAVADALAELLPAG